MGAAFALRLVGDAVREAQKSLFTGALLRGCATAAARRASRASSVVSL